MAAASRDVQGLLAGLDPSADVAQRHIWLIDIFDWVRGDRASPQAAIDRVQLLLDAVEARPELRERLRAWWRVFTQTVDLTTLLADYGFAPGTAFASELTERLRRKILPGTPETTDASDLFRMVLPGVFDAGWIALLDETQLARIGALLAGAAPDTDGAPRWRHTVIDAVTYCASQVVAAGFSPELRLRMSADAVGSARPFHALMADLDELREQMFDRPGQPRDEEALQAAFIVGEFIIGSGNAEGGLGVQIVFAQGRMYTALLFAEVIAATLLGFLFFLVVSAIGRLLLRHWHESALGS